MEVERGEGKDKGPSWHPLQSHGWPNTLKRRKTGHASEAGLKSSTVAKLHAADAVSERCSWELNLVCRAKDRILLIVEICPFRRKGEPETGLPPSRET